MRIIKEGTPPGDVEIETICRNCGTEFAFKVSEATEKFDRNDSYYLIKCPLPGRGRDVTTAVTRPTFPYRNH